MNSPISAKIIAKQITDDINACHTLLDLLQQERQALSDRDADALADVIEKKNTPMAQLESSAQQRAGWSKTLPGDKPSEQWNTIMVQLKHDNIQQDWEKLKQLTEQCREKNEVNGKILVRQKQVYGRLLEILRGQNRAPNLYNAMGAATGPSQSYKLDEA